MARKKTKKQKTKWTTRVLCAAFVIIILFVFFHNTIVREALEVYASHKIGAKIKIQDLDFDIFKQTLDVRSLQAFNPRGFEKECFLDVNHAHFEFNFFALFFAKVHFPVIDLDIKQIVIVEKPDDTSNFDALKIVRKNKQVKKRRNIRPFKFKISELHLNIHKVVQKDLGRKTPIVTVRNNPIVDKTYSNIASVEKFIVLVLFEAVRNMAIRSAGIHAASSVLGISSIPISVASFLLKKDNDTSEFAVDFDEVFQKSLKVADKLGKVLEVRKDEGYIKARIYSAKAIIRVRSIADNKTTVNVQVRKWMIARKQHAAGILYLIAEEINQ